MKRLDVLSVITVLSLLALDVFLWREILLVRPIDRPEIDFVDVGQGDGTLLILPGGVRIMTDAGPDAKVVKSLERILSSSERYIDIGVISHPQLDHFEGYSNLLDHYRFGLFISNGRSDEGVPQWNALLSKIKERRVPMVILGEGDRIVYGENQIGILSPDQDWLESGELNDTGLVEMIKTKSFNALLTADIGFDIENYVAGKYDIRADILKVPHHGSQYSSGDAFLAIVRPKVAVIEVGALNRYGHPTEEALARLSNSGAKIFRTDQNGDVKIFEEGGQLKVFTER